jgi:hypothetical protein
VFCFDQLYGTRAKTVLHHRCTHINPSAGAAFLLLPQCGYNAPSTPFDHPKGDQPCHVEPLSRLQRPSSLASDALRPFQLTPLRTAVAVALVFITVAFTVAFTAVQPYAVGWR